MLAALGIAAVGCTTTSSFTQSDADRFTALTHLTPAVPESLDPILLPPSRPAPAPLGPISYDTLPAQQHPSSGSLQSDGQRTSSQAAVGNTTSTGSRGRPLKEPKLSGMQAINSVHNRHQSRICFCWNSGWHLLSLVCVTARCNYSLHLATLECVFHQDGYVSSLSL